MNKLKKNSFLFCLGIFSCFSAMAITQPPVLQRVCLDRITGQATLYIKAPTDPCASFKYYKVYGRENAFDPYEKLGQTGTLNVNSVVVTLPTKKKWELYVTVFFGCNGTDTFNSNKVFVDDQAPAYVEPDSVSVDMLTQKIYGGWSKPADADIMGYSLFKVDPINGTNTVIDEQNVLAYTFNTTTFNSNTGGNRLAIAAYDSCRNGGVISEYHSPILLSVSVPNNYKCSKKINLSWSPYVGWPTESNLLYVFDLTLNKAIAAIPLSGAITTYSYTLPYLNATFAFLMRSKKKDSAITSSSNMVSAYVPDFPKPAVTTHISYASVENPTGITVVGNWQSGDSATLYNRKDGGAWTVLGKYSNPTSSFTVVDPSVSPLSNIGEYMLIRFNSCGQNADTSLIHNNLRLNFTGKTLNWNEYSAWKNNSIPFDYAVEKWNGSTWNIIQTTSSLSNNPSGYGKQRFRITAKPNPPLSYPAWSHSNEVEIDLGYDSTLYDTTFIPNGFSPEGINSIFRISNPAILPGQAIMQVYNRWGEMIFKGDALTGWDGTYQNNYVSPGIYIYLIEAEYRNKRNIYKGTITLIR